MHFRVVKDDLDPIVDHLYLDVSLSLFSNDSDCDIMYFALSLFAILVRLRIPCLQDTYINIRFVTRRRLTGTIE